MKPILIFGFPHCGTSILKSIIGHIGDVEEIVEETYRIPRRNRQNNKEKTYVVCKFPFTLDIFFTRMFEEYDKIFILRHPFHVFTSLNKRFHPILPKNHGIPLYIKTLSTFLHYRANPFPKLFTIRYEDLFLDNHRHLKDILDAIGLQYSDRIFDNSLFQNRIVAADIQETSQEKPDPRDHCLYRTWQINQPFRLHQPTVDISPSQRQELLLHKDMLLLLYPEIDLKE